MNGLWMLVYLVGTLAVVAGILAIILLTQRVTVRWPGVPNWLKNGILPMMVAVGVIVFVSFFFSRVFPLWNAGYKEAGGPPWWFLLLGAIAISAIATTPMNRAARTALLALLGGLMFLTVAGYLIAGLVYRLACLPDDVECLQKVEEAQLKEEQEEEQAAADRRLAAWLKYQEFQVALKAKCSRDDPDFYFAPEPDPDHPLPQNCRVVIDVPDGMCFFVRERGFKFAGIGEVPKKGPYGRCSKSRGRSLPPNVEYVWAYIEEGAEPENGGGYWGTLELEPRGS